MLTDIMRTDLEFEVWECLERVNDPELDEPVTDMGFIERIEVIDNHRVEVVFRLPTYWCSPNFAFLMAFGIRREIETLRWVRDIRVELSDHCFGDEVNEGVNSGRAFSAVFAQYCDDANLESVAETFMAKAFDRRQEAMLLGLRRRGLSAERIVSMSLGEFDCIPFADEEAIKQKPRYRELLLSCGLAEEPGDLAFPTWEGQCILPDRLQAHLERLRGVRINMEFNGAMCRGLASTRYKEVEIGPDGPTLVDFIAGRVPPRDAAKMSR